jgi:hypothetical protein
MAKATRLANATVNGQADDLARRLDDGYLRIYDGTQPANADTAVSTQVLLAELRFAATSAPAAVDGVLTFNDLTAEDAALATGTASWYRALSDDGATVVMDGSVGLSNANMVIDNTSIVAGAQVSITGFTHTVAKSASGL